MDGPAGKGVAVGIVVETAADIIAPPPPPPPPPPLPVLVSQLSESGVIVTVFWASPVGTVIAMDDSALEQL